MKGSCFPPIRIHGAAGLRGSELHGAGLGGRVSAVRGVEVRLGGRRVPPRQHLPPPRLHGGQRVLWTPLPVQLPGTRLLLLHNLGLVGSVHHGVFPVEFGALRGVFGTGRARRLPAKERLLREGVPGAVRPHISKTGSFTRALREDSGLL